MTGYRLTKRQGNGDEITLVSNATETSCYDIDVSEGDRYRLFAINGLGDEFFLGEAGAETGPLTRGVIAYPQPMVVAN